MGRFTLRDEGKTIAVGKVLKYKPFSKGIVGASKKPTTTAAQKLTQQLVTTAITPVDEQTYNMDTGETKPKKKDMDAIVEGDEEEN
jgi:hypothetical protein